MGIVIIVGIVALYFTGKNVVDAYVKTRSTRVDKRPPIA